MSKFYVVWKGRQSGVYATWDEARAQVDGFPGAQYASARNEALARAAFAGSYQDFISGSTAVKAIPAVVRQGYAVDASLPGESGVVEYRGVKIATGKQIFRQGPFEGGTNNIGEFLAIVHALAMFKQKGITAPLYSDSRTALAWVREKQAKTELALTDQNAPLFALVERAEAWLRENDYDTPVLKWDTEAWGENPADFGRK